jgi:hypoxanthine phosphoribosyltransferase
MMVSPGLPMCYVLMPFGLHGEYIRGKDEADYIYNRLIHPSIEKAFDGPVGTKVLLHREIDNLRSGAIMRSIVQRIASADIVIVDLTGNNPNVFFELGIRYVLQRNVTILLLQDGIEAPFDLHHLRHLRYDILKPELAISNLCRAIKATLGTDETDSPVYEALPELRVSRTVTDRSNQHMPWQEYWARFKVICRELERTKKNRRYIPDALVGITHGGAMFADLLAYELDYDCPVVSLWAKRRPAAEHIFTNDINLSTANSIRQLLVKNKSKNILVVDDLLAYGATSEQAIRYLEQNIPGSQVLFLPLFSRNSKILRDVSVRLIWNHSAFKFDKKRIEKFHEVAWPKFPFGKSTQL